MDNALLNSLKTPEDIDWENHPGMATLKGAWTVIKWLTLGVVVAAGMILWFIFSVVFAGLFEKEFK